MMINETIKKIRIKNNMSIREMSEFLGCSVSALSKIENNKMKPSEKFLGNFSDKCGVALSMLKNNADINITIPCKNRSVDIGKRIKELRTIKNKSSAELALEAGISQAAVSLMENGKIIPGEKTVEKISAVLETSPDYLLTGDVVLREYPLTEELMDILRKSPEIRKKIYELVYPEKK